MMNRIRPILALMLTPIEYLLDWVRSCIWSKASPLCPKSLQLRYDILLLAHTVEKGLSMDEPRKQFGQQKITNLLRLLNEYDDSWSRLPLEQSYGCLKSYVEWHQQLNWDVGALGTSIFAFLDRCRKLGLEPRGGLKTVSLNTAPVRAPAENFLLSRFSCRSFLPVALSAEVLDYIANVALRAPSQCNRQSSRVHYFSDTSQIDRLLKLQGGAEGFRRQVHNLVIVTSEISAWSSYKARSQAYVDGALTAMQVMNACHSLGLGACPLNLAVTNTRERAICEAAGISFGERLIMMIAFGEPRDCELNVARSERLAPHEIFIKHV